MRHVNVLRAQFARRRLRDRPQTELGAGEGRIAASAAQARRRTGEVALATGQHQARGLAAGEKAGIASHFPDLAEHPFGRVEKGKVDVGGDVEDANLERRVLVGVAEKRDDLVFLARIERARVNFAAGLFDLLDERFELGAVAASREPRSPRRRTFLQSQVHPPPGPGARRNSPSAAPEKPTAKTEAKTKAKARRRAA